MLQQPALESQAPSPDPAFVDAPCGTTDEAYLARENEIRQFFAICMKDGVDYGKMPGRDKNGLFKPGAKKLITRFGMAPKAWVSYRHFERNDKGLISYIAVEATVELYDRRSGHLLACEVAGYTSQEIRGQNVRVGAEYNKCARMAKKRAEVSAVHAALNLDFILGDEDEDHRAQQQRDHRSENRRFREQREQSRGSQHTPVPSASGPSTPGRSTARPAHSCADNAAMPRGGELINDQQRGAILALARKRYDEQVFLDSLPKPLEQYSRSEAAELIRNLQAKPDIDRGER